MAVDADGATPQVDRKEMLAQQFDEIETGTPAPEPSDKPDRARDEQGKFAKAEAAAEKAAKAPPAPVAATPVAEATPAEEPAWKKPPTSWKKDFHELYGSIDPKLQQYVWDRETQMRSGIENVIPKAKFADEIQTAIQPYMATIQGLGLDAPRAIQGLMKADHSLRTLPYEQRVQYAAQLLGSYGIDINNMQGVQQPPVMDQNYHALQNELVRLKGEWASYTQTQQEQQNALLNTEISSFAQKAEHFEEAKPTMIQLLQSGVASTLEDAYEKAIRLDPDLFETVQNRKQAEQLHQKSAQADAAAKAARKAAVSVKGTTPGTSTTSKAQDRRAMLEEQFSNIDARL